MHGLSTAASVWCKTLNGVPPSCSGQFRVRLGCSRQCQHQLVAKSAAGVIPHGTQATCSTTATKATAARTSTASAKGDPVARISGSLKQLQHTASSLDAEPTLDGLLTAFQQLALIHRQLQQECRQCKSSLYRLRTGNMRPRRAAAVPRGGAAQDAAATEAAQAQLAALNQLRASADDAQDFLLGLVQQLLQDQPPSACSQLLTSSAFRQLNVDSLNRLAVNTFVDKQLDASPEDMAGLMAALALVRCCSRSSSNQVAGFERSQLSSLFSGIMSHLLAHVNKALEQLQQQPTSDRRRRRQPTNATTGAAATAVSTAASVCMQSYRQQVAAALAAHVSARVPFNSSLAPHVQHILQDETPKWLHTLSDVESALSIHEMSALVSHPSRCDYTYLAAALNRLAELSEHQQQQQQQPDVQEGLAVAIAQQRLTRLLVGRLKQLQADATVGELLVALTAANKLGVQDGRFFATAAAKAASGDNLASATDTHLSALMYAVAMLSSSKANMPDFTKQQQQSIMRKWLLQLVRLLEQQQHPRVTTTTTAAAAAGSNSSVFVQPSNVLLALWAASSAGVTVPEQLRLGVVFDYLTQPAVVQQLTGCSSSSVSSRPGARHRHTTPEQQQQDEEGLPLEEVARSCGTVIWAAAQLGFSGNLDILQPYMAAFLDSTRAIPVPCSSILTVVVSLATLLNRLGQAQQQGQVEASVSGAGCLAVAGDRGIACWQSSFLQCSHEVVLMLQQQQEEEVRQAATASTTNSEGASHQAEEAVVAAALMPYNAAAVVSQLLWSYQTAGLIPSNDLVAALLQLTGTQAPRALCQVVLEQALAAAASVQDVLEHLQSPTAPTALADPGTAAAVLQRMVDLQQQQAMGHKPACGDTKATVKQCCSIVSQHLLPVLQQHFAAGASTAAPGAGQDVSQAMGGTAVASSAAAVMWCLPQLQHKDSALAAACLQAFTSNLAGATPCDAAAVVAALSEAGRAVSSIYSCDSTLLHVVLAACTDMLRQQLAEPPAANGTSELVTPAAAGDPGGTRITQQGAGGALLLAGQTPAVLAQKLLQVHAAVGLQPSAEQTFQLLSIVADASWLSLLKDNAAVAAVVGSLSAVAELSALPGWEGICVSTSSSYATGNARQGRKKPHSSSNSSNRQGQQLQFPWAWQSQQQQLLQELCHQLLLDALLPRLTSATAKQLSSTLQAVVRFAGQDGSRTAVARVAGAALPLLDIGLAKDFGRAVLDVLAPQPWPAAAVGATGNENSSGRIASRQTMPLQAAGVGSGGASDDLDFDLQHQGHPQTATGDSSSGSSPTFTGIGAEAVHDDFLSDWKASDWKGEHLASVAAAAAALGVSRPSFFAAAQADLLNSLQPASTGRTPAALQQRKPRVANVQLPHLISICCAAAALDCRVEPLLQEAVRQAMSLLQQQQADAAAPAAGKNSRNKMRRAQGEVVEAELLLLLGWAVAVMDVPQLAQQAQLLAAAGASRLRAAQLGGRGQAARQQHAADTMSAAAGAAHESVQWLPEVLAARIVQLHLWLLDTLGTPPAIVGGVGSSPGLNGVLSPAELQAASRAWVSLQQGSSTNTSTSSSYSGSIATAMGRLVSEQADVERRATSMADFGLCADVAAVLQGVRVAVVVLDDAEELPAPPAGGLAAAAAESLAAHWLPQGASQPQDSNPMSAKDDPQPGLLNTVFAGTSSSSCQRVLAALRMQRLGDVLFRAKALAKRGFWVEVISSREWMLLEGHADAQVEVLRARLWPLLSPEQASESDVVVVGGASDSKRAVDGVPVPHVA